ncbi:MAG: XRE family transcriptional regulator [Actinomycetia bacterium]|nr:XRE family transcriptional regulator [Actinomycetes bacterium]
MRLPTPGFKSSRLREAREARGLTGVSLEDISGVSARLISNYERDRVSPSPETLAVLASALRMPIDFFLMPDRTLERGTIFNRSLAATTKRARLRSDHRLTWLRDIADYLSNYVIFPEFNLPQLDVPADPLLLTNDDIEMAAADLRESWNLRRGPIANLVLLLENHGVIVARDQLGAQDLEGKSELPARGRAFVFVGTDRGTPARWRFDAAHELGHLVLHSHVSEAIVRRPENFSLIESQAHRFAAAFMLPAVEFGEELFAANLDALRALKPRWKTSIAMMITRMSDLGFIDEETKRKLWISYSKRKWRRHEPFDDTMEPEIPRLLARSFEMTLQEGLQTADDVKTALALEFDDIERLSSLPSGFFKAYAPVRTLRSVEQRTNADRVDAPAEVVQLRRR